MNHPSRPDAPRPDPIEIARAALRDAALAPTVFDALDVTGEALQRVAELLRARVSVRASHCAPRCRRTPSRP
ncbi:MAG TPA: hypothetical protein VL689_00450 [Paraburkholderia sp.]|nr:hypothetical protein [Paraburkholderia sp.]